ncbi:hypothetical protein MASR1M74_27930 [Lentimicrobium sp.]
MKVNDTNDAYEYLQWFNLLVSNRKIIGDKELLPEYLVELHQFIKEATSKQVENIMIHVSGELVKQKPVFQRWVGFTLLPILKESRIKKIAFVLNSTNNSINMDTVLNTTPLLGLFSTKPDALAWISSLKPHKIIQKPASCDN